MNRALILTAAIALIAASTAFAADRTYEGKVRGDANSAVTLKVDRDGGDAVVRSFVARKFEIDCGREDAELSKARISGSVEVSDSNRFEIGGSDGEIEFQVRGRLIGKQTAKGSFTYSGPTEVDDRERDCESGELRWKATR